ncbi:uncharacterized protein LOC113212110 [Frankliniella occidentalis]|uniref:Uncharacterized protein LOC113212110 n=1 Tax=Frankliniella occidentalis TaxID=133901 RepID=A0A6J1T761_FRAOC|nr:uncharacterized protein LOC113212110 [Frankliniella occidentalis]
MSFVLVAGVVSFLSLQCHSQRLNSIAGPFRVIPKHAEHCPEHLFGQKGEIGTWAFSFVRDRQDVNTHYATGNFTTLYWFGDNLNVELSFSSWSSRGGWKENALVLRLKHLCKTGKTYMARQWKNAQLAIHPNNASADCPFPPGMYKVRNATVDLGVTRQFPAFFYGKWRIDVKIIEPQNNTGCISCLRAFAEVVPQVYLDKGKAGAMGGAEGIKGFQNNSDTNVDFTPIEIPNV